jgi:ADP-ribose pyrophosphatase YjhB (NUDIX family)
MIAKKTAMPANSTSNHQAKNSSLVAATFSLTGGNSRAARSMRARLQRRDKDGQFAEMGGGFSYTVKLPSGGMSRVSGRVVGMSTDERIDLEITGYADIPNGIYTFPSRKGEAAKAVLGPEALKDLPKNRETVDSALAVDLGPRADKPSEWISQEDPFEDALEVPEWKGPNGLTVRQYADGYILYDTDESGAEREVVRGDSWADILQKPDGEEEIDDDEPAFVPAPTNEEAGDKDPEASEPAIDNPLVRSQSDLPQKAQSLAQDEIDAKRGELEQLEDANRRLNLAVEELKETGSWQGEKHDTRVNIEGTAPARTYTKEQIEEMAKAEGKSSEELVSQIVNDAKASENRRNKQIETAKDEIKELENRKNFVGKDRGENSFHIDELLADPEVAEELKNRSEAVKQMARSERDARFSDGEYIYAIHWGATELQGGALDPARSRGEVGKSIMGNTRQVNDETARFMVSRRDNAKRQKMLLEDMRVQVEETGKIDFKKIEQQYPSDSLAAGAARSLVGADRDSESTDSVTTKRIDELISDRDRTLSRLDKVADQLIADDYQYTSTYRASQLEPLFGSYGGRYAEEGSDEWGDNLAKSNSTGIHIFRVKIGDDATEENGVGETHLVGKHVPIASLVADNDSSNKNPAADTWAGWVDMAIEQDIKRRSSSTNDQKDQPIDEKTSTPALKQAQEPPEPADKIPTERQSLQNNSVSVAKKVIVDFEDKDSSFKRQSSFDTIYDIGGKKIIFTANNDRYVSVRGAPEDLEIIPINPYEISGFSQTSEEGRDFAMKWLYAKLALFDYKEKNRDDKDAPPTSEAEALLYSAVRGDESAMARLNELAEIGENIFLDRESRVVEQAKTSARITEEEVRKLLPKLDKFGAPSLSDEQKEEVERLLTEGNIDDVYVVHQNEYDLPINENGDIVIKPASAYDIETPGKPGERTFVPRHTIHTALNHVVDPIANRGWPQKSNIIVIPLRALIEANPGALDVLYPLDTFFTPPPGEGLRFPAGSYTVLKDVVSIESATEQVSEIIKNGGGTYVKNELDKSGNLSAVTALSLAKDRAFAHVIAKIAAELKVAANVQHSGTPFGQEDRLYDNQTGTVNTALQSIGFFKKNARLRLATGKEGTYLNIEKEISPSDDAYNDFDFVPEQEDQPVDEETGAPDTEEKEPELPIEKIEKPKTRYDNIEGWARVGGKKGSNRGGTYKDENGILYYVKHPMSDLHGENEALASALYKEAGVASVGVYIGAENGEIRTVSPIVPNDGDLGYNRDSDLIRRIREGFAVDAWLANWDVAGLVFDNIIIDESGRPIRVDPGGALMWRAQGEPKGKLFGDVAGEIDSLRNKKMAPEASVLFGGMSEDDVRESAKLLLNITPERIDDLVDSIVSDPDAAAELKEKLKNRRQGILDRFNLSTSDADIKLVDTSESDVDAADILPEWLTIQPADPGQLSQRLTDYYKNEKVDPDFDIIDYQGGGYAGTNDKLRAGEIPSKVFDHVFDKVPALPETAILYRGVSGGYADHLISLYGVGEMFTDLGYASTSIDPYIARDEFARYGSTGVLLEIIAPEGTRGIYLNGYLGESSEYVDEEEFLLDRGTTFRVISVTEDEDEELYAMRVAIVSQRSVKKPTKQEKEKEKELAQVFIVEPSGDEKADINDLLNDDDDVKPLTSQEYTDFIMISVDNIVDNNFEVGYDGYSALGAYRRIGSGSINALLRNEPKDYVDAIRRTHEETVLEREKSGVSVPDSYTDTLKSKDSTTLEVANATTQLIDGIFDEAPSIERKMILFRGVTSNFGSKLEEYEIGETFTDFGFGSASISEETAKEFIYPYRQHEDQRQGVIVEILTGEDTRAISPAAVMQSYGAEIGDPEKEILIDRGTTYQVVSKTDATEKEPRRIRLAIVSQDRNLRPTTEALEESTPEQSLSKPDNSAKTVTTIGAEISTPNVLIEGRGAAPDHTPRDRELIEKLIAEGPQAQGSRFVKNWVEAYQNYDGNDREAADAALSIWESGIDSIKKTAETDELIQNAVIGIFASTMSYVRNAAPEEPLAAINQPLLKFYLDKRTPDFPTNLVQKGRLNERAFWTDLARYFDSPELIDTEMTPASAFLRILRAWEGSGYPPKEYDRFLSFDSNRYSDEDHPLKYMFTVGQEVELRPSSWTNAGELSSFEEFALSAAEGIPSDYDDFAEENKDQISPLEVGHVVLRVAVDNAYDVDHISHVESEKEVIIPNGKYRVKSVERVNETIDESKPIKKFISYTLVTLEVVPLEKDKKALPSKALAKAAEELEVNIDVYYDEALDVDDVEQATNKFSLAKTNHGEAADAVIYRESADGFEVLMISREFGPFRGAMALPGGFRDPDESFPDTADREMSEEVGVTAADALKRTDLGAVLDSPDWDPRFVKGMSVGAVAYEVDSGVKITAGDDATGATWVSVSDLAEGKYPIAFGHVTWLAEAFKDNPEYSRKFEVVKQASKERNARLIEKINEVREELGEPTFAQYGRNAPSWDPTVDIDEWRGATLYRDSAGVTVGTNVDYNDIIALKNKTLEPPVLPFFVGMYDPDDPESGEGYYFARSGNRYWGRYGAAGVLLRRALKDGEHVYLLAKRAAHISAGGGKWAWPGGAHKNKANAESPQRTAYEELQEELGITLSENLFPVGIHTNFVEPDWSYKTMIVDVTGLSSVLDSLAIGDDENSEYAWFTDDDILALRENDELHPAVASSLDEILGISRYPEYLRQQQGKEEKLAGETTDKFEVLPTGRPAIVPTNPLPVSASAIEGTDSLMDAIGKVRNSNQVAASAFVDSGDIIDLEVRASVEINEDTGESRIALRYRLTPWAAKQFIDTVRSRVSDGSLEIFESPVTFSKSRIEPNTGSIIKSSSLAGMSRMSATSVAAIYFKGSTVTIDDSQGTTGAIYEVIDSGSAWRSEEIEELWRTVTGKTPDGQLVKVSAYEAGAYSDTVTVYLPMNATEDQVAASLSAAGVSNVRAATKEDLDVLIENRLFKAFKLETNPKENVESQWQRSLLLEQIKETHGITPDDIELNITDTGRIETLLPPKKAIELAKNLEIDRFEHQIPNAKFGMQYYTDNPDPEIFGGINAVPREEYINYIANGIISIVGGQKLNSTMVRMLEGNQEIGLSSDLDIALGSANYVFVTPMHELSPVTQIPHDLSETVLVFSPRSLLRRLDIYGNREDEFGARKSQHDIYGDLDLSVDSRSYEALFKHEIEFGEHLEYVSVPEAVKDRILEILKSSGITSMYGVSVDEFFVTHGESKTAVMQENTYIAETTDAVEDLLQAISEFDILPVDFMQFTQTIDRLSAISGADDVFLPAPIGSKVLMVQTSGYNGQLRLMVLEPSGGLYTYNASSASGMEENTGMPLPTREKIPLSLIEKAAQNIKSEQTKKFMDHIYGTEPGSVFSSNDKKAILVNKGVGGSRQYPAGVVSDYTSDENIEESLGNLLSMFYDGKISLATLYAFLSGWATSYTSIEARVAIRDAIDKIADDVASGDIDPESLLAAIESKKTASYVSSPAFLIETGNIIEEEAALVCTYNTGETLVRSIYTLKRLLSENKDQTVDILISVTTDNGGRVFKLKRGTDLTFDRKNEIGTFSTESATYKIQSIESLYHDTDAKTDQRI